MFEYKIRFAEIKDLDEVVKLCRLHAEYEQSIYNEKGKRTALQENIFKQNPSLYCLVVESEGKLIGYATYMKQFSTWDANHYIYMDCLFLKESARGVNIGEKLMSRIKAEAKKLSCNLIQWQTPGFNTRAIKFYSRIGASSLSKERFFLT